MTVILGLSLLFLLKIVVLRLFCPVQVQQTEAYMVDRAFRFFRSESLYPDPAQGGPYLFTAYPPLFFFAQACLLKWIGGIWLAGRSLAVMGYLGCGALLMVWGWKRWGTVGTLFTAGLFLLSPTWATWGSMVRPDTLSLFFHLAAFLILFKDSLENSDRQSGVSRLVLAGILAAVAVGLKQTSLTLWLAYGFYTVAGKHWRKLGWFLLGAVPPFMVLVVGEEWSTHGMFLKFTALWLDTGYDLKTLFYFFFHGFLREAGWLVIGVVVIRYWRIPNPLLKWQVLFSVLQLLSLGRNGGAENYWLEFWLYGILFIAEGIWLLPSPKTSAVPNWFPFLLAPAAILSSLMYPWPQVPSDQTVQMKLEASKYYKIPGDYLALDLDLPLMGGKPIYYQPVEYQYLFLKDRWKLDPLLADIRTGKFVSIELYDIPTQYLLPDRVVKEIETDYRLAWKAYGRRWYVPREKN